MALTVNADLPTLYEYYTAGGINAGLSVDQKYFTLNDRNITLYSGAMHYFRVPREYWRDRLRKMRAAGLNAVETYVPWNLHEPQNGTYDFGEGGSDMQDFLNIREFFKVVQEEDLFAIVRPGPYICTEWEFGGFPSWLLREKNIKLRTSDTKYMQYVKRYFNILLPILAYFQFTKGGPIIGVQVENEYGSTYEPTKFEPDREYLRQLKQIMLDNGIVELLFTSDGVVSFSDKGTLPGELFATANFDYDANVNFNALKAFQPDKPFMAMEFWIGWFDHWSETHHTRSASSVRDTLEQILAYPASVNFYMFHGGTSFGFMNGANVADGNTDNRGFQPDTSSYDYDAPLTEAGDYTDKYVVIKEVIAQYNGISTKLPEAPAQIERAVYPDLAVSSQLLFNEIVERIPEKFEYADVIPMELLPINNNSGQSYGYILYRKEHVNLTQYSVLKIGGHVCDVVLVLVNGVLVSKPLTQIADLNDFGFWRQKDSTLVLNSEPITDATIELLVENWGRVNFGKLGQFNQYKGLWQDSVYLNNEKLSNWQTVPLEFKTQWINQLQGWHKPVRAWAAGPALYKIAFSVAEPEDTFIDMSQWTKGIVAVNGFVLGKYARIGPQQTLYLPAPFMKRGLNEIVIFEQYLAAEKLSFSKEPIYWTAPYKIN